MRNQFVRLPPFSDSEEGNKKSSYALACATLYGHHSLSCTSGWCINLQGWGVGRAPQIYNLVPGPFLKQHCYVLAITRGLGKSHN